MRIFLWCTVALMFSRAAFGLVAVMDRKYPYTPDPTKYRATDIVILLARVAAIWWALRLLGFWNGGK